MATITEVRKLLNDESQTDNGQTTYHVSYLVTVAEDTAVAYEVEFATHADLPTYGSQLGSNYLFALSRTARRAKSSGSVEAKYNWVIDIEYKAPQTSNGGNGITGSTANSNNIRITSNTVKSTLLTQLAQDDSNTQILNSVNDLYPDPIEIEISDEQITIEWESQTVNTDAIETVRGKINSDTVTLSIPQGNLDWSRTFGYHTLKVEEVDYEAVISRVTQTHCWNIRVVLLYRVDGWDITLPQKGFRWKVIAGTFANANDKVSEWKETAQYLDNDGYKLAAGDPIAITEPIQRYKEEEVGTLLSTI